MFLNNLTFSLCPSQTNQQEELFSDSKKFEEQFLALPSNSPLFASWPGDRLSFWFSRFSLRSLCQHFSIRSIQLGPNLYQTFPMKIADSAHPLIQAFHGTVFTVSQNASQPTQFHLICPSFFPRITQHHFEIVNSKDWHQKLFQDDFDWFFDDTGPLVYLYCYNDNWLLSVDTTNIDELYALQQKQVSKNIKALFWEAWEKQKHILPEDPTKIFVWKFKDASYLSLLSIIDRNTHSQLSPTELASMSMKYNFRLLLPLSQNDVLIHMSKVYHDPRLSKGLFKKGRSNLQFIGVQFSGHYLLNSLLFPSYQQKLVATLSKEGLESFNKNNVSLLLRLVLAFPMCIHSFSSNPFKAIDLLWQKWSSLIIKFLMEFDHVLLQLVEDVEEWGRQLKDVTKFRHHKLLAFEIREFIRKNGKQYFPSAQVKTEAQHLIIPNQATTLDYPKPSQDITPKSNEDRTSSYSKSNEDHQRETLQDQKTDSKAEKAPVDTIDFTGFAIQNSQLQLISKQISLLNLIPSSSLTHNFWQFIQKENKRTKRN